MPSEISKSSAWGHDVYISLSMDSLLAAFGLVRGVIWVGAEGEVDEVMRGVLSWAVIQLLQVSVEGTKMASVLDGLLVSLLPECIVRTIRFIMFSNMIVPLIVSCLVLNKVAQSSMYISMWVFSWSSKGWWVCGSKREPWLGDKKVSEVGLMHFCFQFLIVISSNS